MLCSRPWGPLCVFGFFHICRGAPLRRGSARAPAPCVLVNVLRPLVACALLPPPESSAVPFCVEVLSRWPWSMPSVDVIVLPAFHLAPVLLATRPRRLRLWRRPWPRAPIGPWFCDRFPDLERDCLGGLPALLAVQGRVHRLARHLSHQHSGKGGRRQAKPQLQRPLVAGGCPTAVAVRTLLSLLCRRCSGSVVLSTTKGACAQARRVVAGTLGVLDLS